MELSTYVYIDCLSLLTCSSYYSMRGVVYGGVLYTLSMVWAARRPLWDVIANSILQISDVREAGQVVIYIAAWRHFIMYKRVQ